MVEKTKPSRFDCIDCGIFYSSTSRYYEVRTNIHTGDFGLVDRDGRLCVLARAAAVLKIEKTAAS